MIWKLLQDGISRFDTLFELLQFILRLWDISDLSSTVHGAIGTYEELFEEFRFLVWQLPMLWYGCHVCLYSSALLYKV